MNTGHTNPNSKYTLKPHEVSMPPTTQSIIETPTLPVDLKTPDGVEKTTLQLSMIFIRITQVKTTAVTPLQGVG